MRVRVLAQGALVARLLVVRGVVAAARDGSVGASTGASTGAPAGRGSVVGQAQAPRRQGVPRGPARDSWRLLRPSVRPLREGSPCGAGLGPGRGLGGAESPRGRREVALGS